MKIKIKTALWGLVAASVLALSSVPAQAHGRHGHGRGHGHAYGHHHAPPRHYYRPYAPPRAYYYRAPPRAYYGPRPYSCWRVNRYTGARYRVC